jgi:16S rRNA (cytidine1402-2'-O)-methyltransferase
MPLTIIPTPIGNLRDITLRAIETLKEVSGVVCEDTRVTARLLNHLGIEKPLISFHTNNEHKMLPRLVARLMSGEHLGLVSDAGTPAISDPGFLLVRACVENAISLECLPGPTALIPAIVVSGLPADRFVFEGFLPHKKGRQKRLSELAHEERTMVFYESPHRIVKTLEQMSEFFGDDRAACVVREISKLYEEKHRGTVGTLARVFAEGPAKGEMVIVVSGK